MKRVFVLFTMAFFLGAAAPALSQQGTAPGTAQPAAGDAIAALKKEAAAGDPAAQFRLGQAYFSGTGLDRDYKQALDWYRKAAAQGNADAQLALGAAYYNGDGVAVDYAEMAKWYRHAADRGNVPAIANMGYISRAGWGVKKDNAQAYMWYTVAARLGDTYSGVQRQRLAAVLTADQIREAERQAAKWKPVKGPVAGK